ncbi:hypothetical protein JAAARDRAFT_663278 [Jaapia argillacea MUCL 33604]|uniref:Uncharacterized protein n=1 Tax=Jaapia argillacea MUCL 33604 TaxID=933084 RepID=A0A067PDU1_9AGAM|nr:hypothetical protein JAAARDRAFT_663278 [Jaapia argillacea MUCL 33604]
MDCLPAPYLRHLPSLGSPFLLEVYFSSPWSHPLEITTSSKSSSSPGGATEPYSMPPLAVEVYSYKRLGIAAVDGYVLVEKSRRCVMPPSKFHEITLGFLVLLHSFISHLVAVSTAHCPISAGVRQMAVGSEQDTGSAVPRHSPPAPFPPAHFPLCFEKRKGGGGQ